MKGRFSVLVVDDETDMREVLSDLLESKGYSVKVAKNGVEALRIYRSENVDCVLSDIDMPEMNGMDLLRNIMLEDSDASIIMMTGYSSIEGAVDAIKLGAKDYFTKPFNITEIENVVGNIYNKKQLVEQNQKFRQEILRNKHGDIIGNSIQINELLNEIQRLANSDISVLVTGESGTGKELVSKAIHTNSARSNEPFIPINCAAIPAELLESELFGYEKGAFSGANKTKFGLFEIANKGTLFLDEIGEMPLLLQSKLLRVVEDMKIRRIGGTKEIEIDIRIVCSTNKDLKKEIELQKFRNDLYFRLAAYTIQTPPLRDHLSDLPLLVNKILEKKQKKLYSVSNDIYKVFSSYNWPGNVRELENVIERLLLFSNNNSLDIRYIPKEILGSEPIRVVDPSQNENEEVSLSLEEIEKTHILKILHNCNGDKVAAANVLGIGLKTLYRKLSAYNA